MPQCPGLQHHLLAAAGDVDGDALAAQLPGQLVSGSHLGFGGAFGEIDGLAQAVIDKGLQSGLHADMLLSADILRDDEDTAQLFGQVFETLAGAQLHDVVDDRLAGRPVQTGLDQRLLEQRAGVDQLQVAAVVVDVPDIGQSEDRLAAIALAAGDRGDGAGGGDGGLGGVADAGFADAVHDHLPIQPGAAPVVLVGLRAAGAAARKAFPGRTGCPGWPGRRRAARPARCWSACSGSGRTPSPGRQTPAPPGSHSARRHGTSGRPAP